MGKGKGAVGVNGSLVSASNLFTIKVRQVSSSLARLHLINKAYLKRQVVPLKLFVCLYGVPALPVPGESGQWFRGQKKSLLGCFVNQAYAQVSQDIALALYYSTSYSRQSSRSSNLK